MRANLARTTGALVALAMLLPGGQLSAQELTFDPVDTDAEGEAAPEAAAPEAAAPEDAAAPEEEVPATLEPAPMPSADEDFSADADLFGEIVTRPETLAAEQEAAERARVSNPPPYKKWPGLTLGVQAISSAFTGAAVGLGFGAIGNAIDPRDPNALFGGPHGQLFGTAGGFIIGAGIGSWAGALLMEKPVSPWWSLLGSTAGGAVGTAVFAGLVFGTGENEAAATAGAGLAAVLTIGGAVFMGEVGLPPSERWGGQDPGPAPRAGGSAPDVENRAFPSAPGTLLFPLGSGTF
jgi:hypothetical protein